MRDEVGGWESDEKVREGVRCYWRTHVCMKVRETNNAKGGRDFPHHEWSQVEDDAL